MAAAVVRRTPLPLPRQHAEAAAALADDANNCGNIYIVLENNFGSAMFNKSSEVMSSSDTIHLTEFDPSVDGQTHRVTVGAVFRQQLNRIQRFVR